MNMHFGGKAISPLAIAVCIAVLTDSTQVIAQSNPATVATYTYNYKGERITKTVGGVTTRYGYENGKLISERSPAGNRDYIYLGDLLVNTIDTPATPTSAPATAAYVVTDHTSTPRVATNSAGTVIWQNQYTGNAFNELQPVSNVGYVLNLRSAGEYYDAETGLNYNGQRYRDPTTERFLQPDPMGLAGGINPYAAVSNNPLNHVDPDGLRDIFVGGFGDGWSEIVKHYYDGYHTTNPDSAYYSWTNQIGVTNDIDNTPLSDPVNLIGHSYGGDTAARAAMGAMCHRVNLLITIDPVSHGSIDLNSLRNDVNTWIDVDAEGGHGYQLSNLVAGIGGGWNSAPYGFADSYIQNDLPGVNHEDFSTLLNSSSPGVNSPLQVLGGAPVVNPPFLPGRGGN